MNFIDYNAGKLVPVQVYPSGDKHYFKFPYNKNVKNEIAACEDARWNPDPVEGAKIPGKTWSVKAPELSMRNAVILGYLTKGQYPNSIKDPFKIITDYKKVSLVKSNGKPIELRPLEYFYGKKFDTATDLVSSLESKRILKLHQLEALTNALSLKRYYLAHQMGLGKTLTAIEYMEHVDSIYPNCPCWVIAPKAPLRAWLYELKKWQSKVIPLLISSSSAGIERAIAEAKVPPRVLILDEATEYKNAQANRTQYVMQLRDMMHKHYGYDNYYILAASGTPAPNRVSDWWSQIEILWPGLLQYKNTHQLNRAVADIEEAEGPHGTYAKILGYKNDEVLKLSKKLDQVRDVRFKKDCIDIPDIDYQTINVPYTRETLLACQLIVETSTSTLQCLMRLRQLSDGFQYNKDADDLITTDVINTAKAVALAEELDNRLLNEKTRIVIWGAFRASIDFITQTCLAKGWHVIRADGRGWQAILSTGADSIPNFTPTQEQFQDNNLDVPIAFVGNMESVGLGITLDMSDEAWYMSNSYKGHFRSQSIERIYRMKDQKVTIKDFCHLPTDSEVIERLISKKNIENISLGRLKEIINERGSE